MKHISDEQDREQLSALGRELRFMWQSMMRGLPCDSEHRGMQRQQFWVLGALSQGPRRMSELAAHAQTSQTSLTGIVDRLEEHGLVERVRSQDDRRVIEVTLTPQGAATLKSSGQSMLDRLAVVLQPLDVAEKAEFLRLMSKINAGHEPAVDTRYPPVPFSHEEPDTVCS